MLDNIIRPLHPDTSPFVSRISYGLIAEIGTERYPRLDDAITKTRRRILEWIGEQTGMLTLAHRPPTDPFDEIDRPGVKLGLAMHGSTWIARMERPDRNAPQRTWMTEVSIITQTNCASLVVRNTITAPTSYTDLPRSVPRLVRTIASIIGLFDADEAIQNAPWILETTEEISELRTLVTNPRRFLPVIVVSEPYTLDIHAFAHNLFGVAHVVVLPTRFSFDWSNTIGHQFAVHSGAIRTYGASLNVETSDPYSHPFALPQNIRSFTNSGELAEEAFSRLLIDRAYAANAARLAADSTIQRYTQINAISLHEKRLAAIKSASPIEAQRLAQAEIETLRKQAADALAMEGAALTDNRIYQEENARIRADLSRMQAEFERMRGLLENDAITPEIPIPKSLDNLSDWVDTYISGRVMLLPRALREAKDSRYESPEDIFQALLFLSNEYWRSKAGYCDYALVEHRLAELGMEYGGSIAHGASAEYYVTYNGRRRLLEMALKKGTSRDPRYCMRIYLFWDSDIRKTIVGSLPKHLANSIS